MEKQYVKKIGITLYGDIALEVDTFAKQFKINYPAMLIAGYLVIKEREEDKLTKERGDTHA